MLHRFPPLTIGVLLLGFILSAGPSTGVMAAERNPDWPCVQILVPTLSAGQIWSGDPIEEKEAVWRDSPGVDRLVKQVVDRSSDIDQAEAAIDRFAETLGPERNTVLTGLFAGVFDALNRQRGESIAAIQRYAHQQHALLDDIAADLSHLHDLPPQSPEAAAVLESISWQRRILDERRRYQTALCDQPVQLEQRLGRLARAIAAHLD